MRYKPNARLLDFSRVWAKNLKFYRKELKNSSYVSRLQETNLHVFVEQLRPTKRFTTKPIICAVSTLRNFSKYALGKRLHKRDIERDLKTHLRIILLDIKTSHINHS
jgi:hypothetical protein